EMLAAEQVARALLCMMCELPNETREAFGNRPIVHDCGAKELGGCGINGLGNGSNKDFGGFASGLGKGITGPGIGGSEFGGGTNGLGGADSDGASAAELEEGAGSVQVETSDGDCGLCITSSRNPLQSTAVPPSPVLLTPPQSVAVMTAEAVAATFAEAPLSYDDVRALLGPGGHIPFPRLQEALMRLLEGGQPPCEGEYAEIRLEIWIRCRGGK
ncbi:hypothetical protein Vafri_17005, partial [Volvox africanus]